MADLVILNLKQVLHYYIKHQEDVIRRRTQYELTKAQARAHILEGLTIALDHLDQSLKLFVILKMAIALKKS